MNRIDEFANALDGWLAEWKDKRQTQVSCGTVEGHGLTQGNIRIRESVEVPIPVSSPCGNKLSQEQGSSGYQAPPAGIHLVNPNKQAQDMVNLDDLGITLGAQKCNHCKKELPLGAIYYRGALLHQECRMPYIVALRSANEAPWTDSMKGR